MSTNQRRFSTGLRFLDSRIGGGLKAGELIALTAPPTSQSELLLREFVGANTTLYLSTTRPEAEVRDWAATQITTPLDLNVLEVTSDDLVEKVDTITAVLAPESFLIIDTTNGLEETPRAQYLEFLNAIKKLLRETDSVCVLHCMDHVSIPPRRGLTLNRADQVWQLQVMPLSRHIKTQLLITKARNGRALTEPIDLLLTDRVRIDTSRRIA